MVDERIVGYAPKSLSFAEAAALPLTTITAYEAFLTGWGSIETVPIKAKAS